MNDKTTKNPFMNLFIRKAYENMFAVRNMIAKGLPNKTYGKPFGCFRCGRLMLVYTIHGTGDECSPVHIAPKFYMLGDPQSGIGFGFTNDGHEYTWMAIDDDNADSKRVVMKGDVPLLLFDYEKWFGDLESLKNKPSYEEFIARSEKLLKEIVATNPGFEDDKTNNWGEFTFFIDASDCFVRTAMWRTTSYAKICGFCVPVGDCLALKADAGSDIPPLTVRIEKAKPEDDPFKITVDDFLNGMYELGYVRVRPAGYSYIAQRLNADCSDFSLYGNIVSRDLKSHTVTHLSGPVYGALADTKKTISEEDFNLYYTSFYNHPCSYIPKYIGREEEEASRKSPSTFGHYDEYIDIPENTKVYAVEKITLQRLVEGKIMPAIYAGEVSSRNYGAPLMGFHAYRCEKNGELSKDRRPVTDFEFFDDPDAAYLYAEQETKSLVGQLASRVQDVYDSHPTYTAYSAALNQQGETRQ